MSILLVLPLLVPLFTAIACILLWHRVSSQQILSVVGATLLLAATIGLLIVIQHRGIGAVQIGDWPAPFGITLVADRLTAIMVLMAGVIGFLGAIYSIAAVDNARQATGYHALLHFLLMGVCGAFLTGDIFNFFVWFEVMLIASFVLLVLGGQREQLEGTIKYLLLNMLASLLLLTGVGLLYGLAGTLNLADLAVKLPELERPALLTAVAILFLVALGTKAAIFPLFFWLPASYHTPPVAVTAIFSALLTKAGIYGLFRVFTLLFVHQTNYTHSLLLVLAALTMVTGVLGAVTQTELRRLLSFHIISQIGYMIMGLGLFTSFALAAAIFFIVHITLTKTALFFVSGVMYQTLGTYDLKKLGGLYEDYPGISALFLVPALSLAGMPPFSGFIGKLLLVRAGLESQYYALVATALVVSLLTLYSMAKIWTLAFWKPRPADAPSPRPTVPRTMLTLVAPTISIITLMILMGLAAEFTFTFALQAAEQLLDPNDYIQAVMSGRTS